MPELDALSAISDERDFEVVAKAVRDAIERNQPEAALDRLHTFVIKYVRSLCAARGIDVPRDKPLHSLFGEYLKRLREAGLVESEMTSRILKSSISVLEAFNDVRNNRSLAHDNPILGYEEALLIFNHIAGLDPVPAQCRSPDAGTDATDSRRNGCRRRHPVLKRGAAHALMHRDRA